MLCEIWEYLRPPAGISSRRLAAFMMTTYGVLYTLGLTGSAPGPTPYDNPTDVIHMPLFAFGLPLLAIGLAVLMTSTKRQTFTGHLVAVVAMAVCTFVAGGFYDRFAPMSIFILLAYAMLGEAASKFERS